MTVTSNRCQQTKTAFPRTWPLCAMALLFALFVALPVSALAQQPGQGSDDQSRNIRPVAFHLLIGGNGHANGIKSVGNAVLAGLSGMYVPASSANVIRHDPGVVLWDEDGSPGSFTGTRLQSRSGSNQQSNSLTVVSQ